jgi:hypothetical protein
MWRTIKLESNGRGRRNEVDLQIEGAEKPIDRLGIDRHDTHILRVESDDEPLDRRTIRSRSSTVQARILCA